jgi:hypothetical protein
MVAGSCAPGNRVVRLLSNQSLQPTRPMSRAPHSRHHACGARG